MNRQTYDTLHLDNKSPFGWTDIPRYFGILYIGGKHIRHDSDFWAGIRKVQSLIKSNRANAANVNGKV